MPIRKPLLWLPTIKVEAEIVKPAHKLACYGCGSHPERVRLRVAIGSGRSSTLRVFCASCGREFVERRREEGGRLIDALRRLGHGLDVYAQYDFPVRDPDVTRLDPSHREPKEPKT